MDAPWKTRIYTYIYVHAHNYMHILIHINTIGVTITQGNLCPRFCDTNLTLEHKTTKVESVRKKTYRRMSRLQNLFLQKSQGFTTYVFFFVSFFEIALNFHNTFVGPCWNIGWSNSCSEIQGSFSGWSGGIGYFCSESGVHIYSQLLLPLPQDFPSFFFHGLRDGLLLVIFLHSWAMYQDDARRSYRPLLLSTPNKNIYKWL